jgi:hypothetical protein
MLLDWSARAQAGMMLSVPLLKLAGWRSRQSDVMDGQPLGVGVHLNATQRPWLELLAQRTV